eukprot:gb/GECG01008373.1/.p1 GENE.gb/GECG01008373.1/~~gb/GECG01008373.1/.p1  ORF type:complete len:1331 (+),score=263.48 gb/GECG01008373.1/:1-3993(+)
MEGAAESTSSTKRNIHKLRVFLRIRSSALVHNNNAGRQSIIQPQLDGKSITLVSPHSQPDEETQQHQYNHAEDDGRTIASNVAGSVLNNSMNSFENPLTGFCVAQSTPSGSRRESTSSNQADNNSLRYNEAPLTPRSQSSEGSQPLKTPKCFRSKNFTFDKTFHGTSSQDDVYAELRNACEGVIVGKDSCILSFGARGSGKTHSMFGPAVANINENKLMKEAFNIRNVYGYSAILGMVQKACASIFARLAEKKERFRVKLSFVELYNDTMRDLLADNSRDTSSSSTDNSTRKGIEVQSLQECFNLLHSAVEKRSTRSIGSQVLARSHSVVTIEVQKRASNTDGYLPAGSLTLVDLAGTSEDLREDLQDPIAQLEEQSISLSNSSLTNTLTSLCTTKQDAWMSGQHRSKLTRLLQSCFDGKSRLTILAHVHDSADRFHDSISTLYYAARATEVHGDVSAGYPLTPESASKLETKARTVSSLQNEVDFKSLALEEARKAHAEAASQRDNLQSSLDQLKGHNSYQRVENSTPVSHDLNVRNVRIQTTPSLAQAIEDGDIQSAYEEAKGILEHNDAQARNSDKRNGGTAVPLQKGWNEQLQALREELQKEIEIAKHHSVSEIKKELTYHSRDEYESSSKGLAEETVRLEKKLEEARAEVNRQADVVKSTREALEQRQRELEQQLQDSNELREKEVAAAYLQQTEAWCDVISSRLDQREEKINAVCEQFDADLKSEDVTLLDHERSSLQSQCLQLDHFARRMVDHASSVVEENGRLRDEYSYTVKDIQTSKQEEIERIRQEEQRKAQQELQKAVAVAAQEAQWNGFEKSMDIVQKSTDNAIELLRTKGIWQAEFSGDSKQEEIERIRQEEQRKAQHRGHNDRPSNRIRRSASGATVEKQRSSSSRTKNREREWPKDPVNSSKVNQESSANSLKHTHSAAAIDLPVVYDGAISESEESDMDHRRRLKEHKLKRAQGGRRHRGNESSENDSSFVPQENEGIESEASSSIFTDADSGVEDMKRFNSRVNYQASSDRPEKENRKRQRSDHSGSNPQPKQQKRGHARKRRPDTKPPKASKATEGNKGNAASAVDEEQHSESTEHEITSAREPAKSSHSRHTSGKRKQQQSAIHTASAEKKQQKPKAGKETRKAKRNETGTSQEPPSADEDTRTNVSNDSSKMFAAQRSTKQSTLLERQDGGSIFSSDELKDMQSDHTGRKKKLSGKTSALLELKENSKGRESPRQLLQHRVKGTQQHTKTGALEGASAAAADKENSRENQSFASSTKTGGGTTSVASIGLTTGLAMGMHSFGPHGGFKVPKLKTKKPGTSSSSSSGSRRL